MATISSEEKSSRVSALLRQVDDDVRNKKLDQALEKIRKVYEYDIKNAYARAYEERILVMMVEKERKEAIIEAEKKASEQIDQEVKKRLKDFYKQQELENLKRKQDEKTEQALEDEARKASVNEAQEIAKKDISEIEKETTRKIEELEKKLLEKLQQPIISANNEQIKAEYEKKLQDYQKQFEEAEAARKKIQEEAFNKLKEEQKRNQEELNKQWEQERNVLIEREKDKAKQTALEAYKTQMKLMMQLAVQAEIQISLLQALKINFNITDQEHTQAEKNVQASAYIDAVKSLWSSGKPQEEDLKHLHNLQMLFKISDEEHTSITRQVKKELGIPDESAVIMIIDDDPSIRKYVEHILRKTYQTIICKENAESAIKEIEKIMPSLIISDINLGTGVMSGFSFYEKIIAGTYGEKIKSVPFVLMSSLEDEFFIKSARQLGIKEYMTKPFTKEILENTVKKALL